MGYSTCQLVQNSVVFASNTLQFERLKEVSKLSNYHRHDSNWGNGTNAKMYNFQSEVHLVLDSSSVGCFPLTIYHPATSIHIFCQVFPFHILRHSQPGPCIETYRNIPSNEGLGLPIAPVKLLQNFTTFGP